MSTCGAEFTYPGNSYYRVWYTAMDPVPEDNSDYNEKTVLFSCVDYDRGWEWLHTLKGIYDGIIKNDDALKDVVAVVAMVFKYDGNLTQAALRTAVNGDGTLNTLTSGDPFYIIDDTTWSGSFSQARAGDFAGDIVNDTEHIYWNYIIGPHTVVSGEPNPILDIWSYYDTEPLILYDTTKQEFSTTDTVQVTNYLAARLKNLTSPVRLGCPEPAGPWRNSLSDVTLHFTKPVQQAQAQTANNWSFSGGGVDGLDFAAASPQPEYNALSNPHHEVTLTLNNGIRDSQADKNVTISAENIQDIYGNDAEPETAGGTVIKSPATWKIDLTDPAIDTFDFNGSDCVNTLTAGWSLEASDTPGNDTGPASGIAFRCVKKNPTDPNPDIPTPWTAYDGSEITGSTPLTDQDDGEQTVYAWVKDAAGNVSGRHDRKFTLDRTKPEVTSFTAPAFSNSTTVSVTIGASDDTSGIAAWAVTESSSAPAANDDTGVWKTTGIADPSFSVSISLSSGDGEKTLYAWVKDAAENVSALNNEIDGTEVETSASVLLDTKAPVINTVIITSYPRTDNRTVTFTVNASDPADPGVTEVSGVWQVKYSNTETGGTWQEWTGSDQVFTLQLPDPYTAPDGWGTKDVYVRVRDRAGNPGAVFTAPVKMQLPRDFYLVLDYSGSMMGNQLVIMEESVRALTELVSLWDSAGETDRIGVIKYHTDIYPMTFPGGQAMGRLLEAPETQNATTMDALDDFLDGDCQNSYTTAMGAGLAEALNRLNFQIPDTDEGRKRGVFLLTDGEQNRLPVVKAEGEEGSYSVRIDDDYPEGFYLSPPNNGVTGYTTGIPMTFNQGDTAGHQCYPTIYTLGIGSHGSWLETLRKTAGAGKGIHHANPDTLEAANDFFDSAVIDLYSGDSPQLVFSTRSELSSDNEQGRVFPFLLDKTVTSVAVKLVWDSPEPLSFDILKGGMKITSFDKKGEGAGYQVGILRFPHRQSSGYHPGIIYTSIKDLIAAAGYKSASKFLETVMMETPAYPDFGRVTPVTIEAEGEWSVRVRPKWGGNPENPMRFHLSVIVEETALEIDVGNLPFSITAGQSLPFSVKILEKGHPLLSQYSVTAHIKKPRTSLGSLLSHFEPPNFERLFAAEVKKREITRAEFKFELLMKDKELRKIAGETETERVSLASQWRTSPAAKRKAVLKPVFSGSTKNTRTPGVYQIELTVRGTGKTCGSYQRMIKRSVMVHFKPHVAYTLTTIRVAPAGKNLQAAVVPTDTERNLLGPGWGHSIALTVGKTRYFPEDKTDGAYVFSVPKTVLQKPAGKKVRLSVMGTVIFEGNIEGLTKTGKS